MEYHIGKLIKGIRIEQMVGQEELARGLCTKTVISLIEHGEQEPGKWLADALLERLGVSANKLSCLFKEEEKQEFICRVELLALLQVEEMTAWEQSWKEAWEQCQKQKTGKQKNSAVCQEQFLLYTRLLSEKQTDSRGIMEALTLTVPDFDSARIREYRFDRVERALVVLLADRLLEQEATRQRGIDLYCDILDQAEDQLVDQEERCFQYPLITALLAERLLEYGLYGENRVCGKALELLRKERMLYGLSSILRYEQKRQEVYGEDSGEELNPRTISECIRLLDEGEEAEERRRNILLTLVMPDFRGIMLDEVVWKMRENAGMTRKQMVEKSGGAFTERTLLRFEKGERASGAYIYHRLLRELGQEEYRHVPFIWSDDWKLHEVRRKVGACIANRDFEEADRKLKYLEENLDMGERLNRQMILRLRAIVDEAMGRIDSDEKLNRLYEALSLTVPQGMKIEKMPLKQAEIVLLNNIANVKERKGELREAEEIAKKIRASCHNITFGTEWNPLAYLLTLYNLERYISKRNEYEEALKISEEGLQLARKKMNGEFVVDFLYKIAWNKEKQHKTCLPICRQAFALADVLQYVDARNHIYNHCMTEYKVNLESEN